MSEDSTSDHAPAENEASSNEQQGSELIGTVLAGRYKIDKLLGSGGMGSVYRAEHVHMRKAVAVKVLHRQMMILPEVVARFEREAVAAGRIDHPNVCTARDFGRLEDGSCYLVLEYVEGKSLAKVLEEAGSLPVERVLHIVRQIADALFAAHSANIVHRDLKPENVMLVDRDNFPDLVKVLDFGIAKVKMQDSQGNTQNLTQLGTVFGTPDYMSPEQARGNPVDLRSDLYTLGVIAYEMLTGRTPFKADDLIVVLTRHITEAPPPLPQSVPGPVQALVMKLLEKDPELRFQSAADIIHTIDRMIGPSVAPPESSLVSGLWGESPPAPDDAPEVAGESRAAPLRTNSGVRRAVTLVSARLKKQLRPWLRRRIAIGRYEVRFWVLIAGALGLVFGSALATCALSKPHAPAPAVSLVPGAPEPDASAKALAALVGRAQAGDRAALAELAAKPISTRSFEEWRAIGHGFCAIGQVEACIAKYREGVTKRVQLAKDPLVIADVRRAAVTPEAFREALELAALHLWAPGVDIVYDVWASTKADTKKADVTKRAKEFVDDGSVRAKASPALKATFELQRVVKRQDCGGAKKAVKQATEEGDARAAPVLEQLKAPRGCGLLGLSDCFACLRGTVDLSGAITAAKARPAPTFEAPSTKD